MTSEINGALISFPNTNTSKIMYADGNINPAVTLNNMSTKDGSKSVQDEVETVLNGYIGVLVIFLGLIGNFLTVVVLTRKTMHSSTNFFLAALAIWDMMVLVSTLLLISLPQISAEYMATVFPYIVVYVYPFALIAQTSTVWITVSFTVERFIAVCSPLKAASMCTIARARIVIFAVSISSVLYNICRWFEYKIIDKTEIKDNQTFISKDFEATEFGKNLTFKQVYFLGLYPFIMFIIPLSTLAVLNTFLVLAVNRSRKQQRDMNVRQSRENNVTLMLVSVVIVFMICQVPAMIYNVTYSIAENIVLSSVGWGILSAVRNFLVTFNSAINFILYCAFGQKFRRVFIRTFCYFMVDENNFNSITFHGGTVSTMTKLDKHNKKYKTLLLQHKAAPVNQMEMYSNVTQNTHVSRYSPCASRSPSPKLNVMVKLQNGRRTHGESELLAKHKDSCT